jgi:hypothetical protein
MERRRRKILFIAGVVLTVGVATRTLMPVGRPFDHGVWVNEKQEQARLEMADRIVARRMLDGRPRAEVVAMLGPPRKTEYFSDWDLVYRLGRERGFAGNRS